MGSQYVTRDYAPYALVHFTVRGVNKRPIFLDQADHDIYLNELRDRIDAISSPARPTLLAFAQMRNHQHNFMQAGRDPTAMPKMMRSLSTSYAKYFNDRYGLRGQVFERPFRGKVIRTGEHVANTFAYIHLNPDASLRMENSSHAFYVGLEDDPHIDPTIAWKTFGGRDGYLEYFSDTARLRQARAAAKYRFEQ